MAVVVPLTSQRGSWQEKAPELYPVLAPGAGGLTLESVALLDHIQGLDERRIVRRMGSLSPSEFAPIMSGLHQVLKEA